MEGRSSSSSAMSFTWGTHGGQCVDMSAVFRVCMGLASVCSGWLQARRWPPQRQGPPHQETRVYHCHCRVHNCPLGTTNLCATSSGQQCNVSVGPSWRMRCAKAHQRLTQRPELKRHMQA